MSAISQGWLRIVALMAALVLGALGTAVLAPPAVASAAALPDQTCRRSIDAWDGWDEAGTSGCEAFDHFDIRWNVGHYPV